MKKKAIHKCPGSYAKRIGVQQTDWLKVLSKPIPDRMWEHLSILAEQWPTCAVGNACAIIPRNEDSVPTDGKLYELGLEFCNAIDDADSDKALDIFKRIEKRAAIVIRETLKKKT